jgi:hypothetical protein
VLASRRQAGRNQADQIVMPADRRRMPSGIKRIGLAYGLTLLAAVLGLPGVFAGVITTNNCTLQGEECAERMVYGVIGGIVLAAVVQLVLAVHFRLGWLFWGVSAVIMAAAIAVLAGWPMIIGLLLAPGVAAWVSDSQDEKRSTFRHWLPRLVVLIIVLGAIALIGLQWS